MVEWSCTKERLNEREPYILVESSCTNKKNKSVGTLILVEWSCILLQLKSQCLRGASHHTAFMGKCSTAQFVILNPGTVPWNWIAFPQNSFVISPGLLHDTWLDARTNDLQRPLRFSETIAYGLKIRNCINYTFSVLSTQLMSSS